LKQESRRRRRLFCCCALPIASPAPVANSVLSWERVAKSSRRVRAKRGPMINSARSNRESGTSCSPLSRFRCFASQAPSPDGEAALSHRQSCRMTFCLTQPASIGFMTPFSPPHASARRWDQRGFPGSKNDWRRTPTSTCRAVPLRSRLWQNQSIACTIRGVPRHRKR